jgi:sulfatase modifying factor 1
VTEAERFGWSFVFAGLLPDDVPPMRAVAPAPW